MERVIILRKMGIDRYEHSSGKIANGGQLNRVRQKLSEYVKRILDLSQRNKSIYFAISVNGESDWKQRTIGFKISKNVISDLMNNGEVTVLRFSTIKNEFQGGCVEIEKENWKEAENGLRRLYMKNNEFLKDYGVCICHVVYGFLIWQDRAIYGKGIWVKSPLFVAEANLERKLDRRRGQVVYQLSITTPFRFNESLVDVLRLQYGINLSEEFSKIYEINEAGAIEFEELVELENTIRKMKEVFLELGWRIEQEVWIAALHFGAISIYHDAKYLLESGKLENSPIIRALCGYEGAQFIPHPECVSNEEIDRLETPFPADRSQCEVIWYTEKGANVIVHGPPGTGKSQTIANLIVRAIKNGKRVLFAAEKREAIDVVYSRLEELKLTKPVLRIFTITDKERDHVLRDLLDTLEYVTRTTSLRLSSGFAFPKKEYDYEREYFESLTNSSESSSSLNLYVMIGEITLKERELERFGLLTIANKYQRSHVWKSVQEIDTLALRSYWDHIIKFFKLTFIPSSEELKIIPKLSSLLSSMSKRSYDISQENLLILLNVIKDLHGYLINPRQFEALKICIELDYSQLEKLYGLLTQLLLKVKYLKASREKLRKLPNRDYLSYAYNQLQKYGSWLTRIFSEEYKRLRSELEFLLGISKDISHEKAMASVTSLIDKLNALELEERKERERLKKIMIEVRRTSFGDFLFPLTDDRLKNAFSMIKKILHLRRQSQTAKMLDLLKRDPDFFRGIATECSEDDIDGIIKILGKMPKYENMEALLKTITEINNILQKFSNIELAAFTNVIKQLMSAQKLVALISELPIGTAYEQFETLVSYLALKDQCEQMMHGKEAKLNPRITKICMDKIKTFYNEMEHDFVMKCLEEWLGRISKHRFINFNQRLKREYAKKRKRIGLRQLFNEYLEQILEIKPVLMMSTAVVSAVLPRDFNQPYFDLVIFDEASQIRVETALPSIARAKQLLVIGDECQMPPSRYFERLIFFEEEEEEVEEVPESLLGACLENASTGFFKELWLEWYYRGSHESLIAFSNKYFYKNKLIIFPSPNPEDSRVEFVYNQCPRHPAGGCYIEGRAINLCEARVVLRKLLEILAKIPDSNFTVGIVAMNEKQQEVIENLIQEVCQEMNLARMKEVIGMDEVGLDRFVGEQMIKQLIVTDELIDKLEAMYSDGRIWIRNLESVQGKEADYIILSITYGRGKDGKLRQQFGPINREGGERRINVLISRAKEKMIVISSIKAADLRVGPDTPKGVSILRDFLKYAEDGGRFGEEREEDRSFESPFEESVYYHLVDALSDLGVKIVPQVGVGKYRIDLGIKKDEKYLLGIECDGALFHKHRVARERDRIRDECLRRMGWEIYRIWSTTWLNKRLRTEIINEIRSKVIDKLNQMVAQVGPHAENHPRS